MRQALEEDGAWRSGALSVEASSVMVAADGALVLGGRAGGDGVVMRRIDPETGEPVAEFRAASIRYLALNEATIECRLTEVRTTDPDTGEPVRMTELHFAIPLGEAAGRAEGR